ncbi:tyrosine-protein kinase Src64B-like isoform X2 [Neocloeon triangulifer]|uniref:tyrosine-protein kinase Src64B-like isoform X2 n=1 Tax=Neocloeon triangulifer TaxID=2078957 RepID=UPI00286F3AFE|nr:tyrosine-protein kinase Src64B-like isoform X2 [Neocloeon triangulifer]
MNYCCHRKQNMNQSKISGSVQQGSGTNLYDHAPAGSILSPVNYIIRNPHAQVAKPKIYKLVLALYDFKATQYAWGISFKEGDKMVIFRESNKNWWFARNLRTKQVGHVPSNFVDDEQNVIKGEVWFFGHTSKEEAVNLLLTDGNPRGTFLIRKSTLNPKNYVLSVREKVDQVRHYEIIAIPAKAQFYIVDNQPFLTLQTLVKFYSKNPYGIFCRLTRPCPKPLPGMWESTIETIREIDLETILPVLKLSLAIFVLMTIFTLYSHPLTDRYVYLFKQYYKKTFRRQRYD